MDDSDAHAGDRATRAESPRGIRSDGAVGLEVAANAADNGPHTRERRERRTAETDDRPSLATLARPGGCRRRRRGRPAGFGAAGRHRRAAPPDRARRDRRRRLADDRSARRPRRAAGVRTAEGARTDRRDARDAAALVADPLDDDRDRPPARGPPRARLHGGPAGGRAGADHVLGAARRRALERVLRARAHGRGRRLARHVAGRDRARHDRERPGRDAARRRRVRAGSARVVPGLARRASSGRSWCGRSSSRATISRPTSR